MPSWSFPWLASLALAASVASAASIPAQNVSSAAVAPDAFAKSKFDFIIVGGGTSGLVLARRLTENPKITVGILEAGEYRPGDDLIEVPTGGDAVANSTASTIGNPDYDWMFKSTPQAHLNGSVISYPRGKVVGGSTALNSMIWQRPSKAEYDNIGTVFGNPGWSFDNLSGYFEKIENWHAPTVLFPGQLVTNALTSEHGTGGPISVSYDTLLTDVDSPAIRAANAINVPTNSNPDGGNETYLTMTSRSVNPTTGRRSWASNGYFTPIIGRPNLKLVTGVLVTKIDFVKKQGKIVATGVQYTANGHTYTATAGKEVILAAGSLKTPQLLELSGVGNKSLLKSLGIPVVLDLPTIGENLQDHPVALSDFQVDSNLLTLDRLNNNATYAQEQLALYNANASGIFTYTPAVVGSLPLQTAVNQSVFNSMLATLEKAIASESTTPLQKVQYKALINMAQGGQLGWFELTIVPSGGLLSTPQPGSAYITSVVIQLHEFSRGSVHINTTDPTASPLINPNFLSLQWDVDVLAHGLQWVRKWTHTSPLGNLVEANVTPPDSVSSDAQWENYVRSTVQTTNHPIGTTAMTTQELGGVVNPRLKVYGLDNVRIVDAGVIPMTLGVAIQGTVYAIAEKAADLVKQDWNI
ncbi:alcohol oxidase [Artomyces pyxidatus]|uniref:Alcohol oxidase n=1 Tax=Artomyces pyxidatus TaxID=48021 RepID=A0ACB8TF26_9AGAM|nr:alcohol oxidase [Artomyces pyxidatus]